MNEQRVPGDAAIAIVGGGASGVLVALQLLRQATAPLQIVMIEPSAALGEGVAYATARPEHLLNVPAARMSALAELPGDFVAYLQATQACPALDAAQLPQQFVGRCLYAPYLRARLQEACARSPPHSLSAALAYATCSQTPQARCCIWMTASTCRLPA